MKRQIVMLITVLLTISAIGIQQAPAQTADEIITNFLEQDLSIEWDGETLVVSTDQRAEIETNGRSDLGRIDLDLVLEADTGEAYGRIRLESSGTGKTFAAEIIAGSVEYNSDNTVRQIRLDLTTAEGQSATATLETTPGRIPDIIVVDDSDD